MDKYDFDWEAIDQYEKEFVGEEKKEDNSSFIFDLFFANLDSNK